MKYSSTFRPLSIFKPLVLALAFTSLVSCGGSGSSGSSSSAATSATVSSSTTSSISSSSAILSSSSSLSSVSSADASSSISSSASNSSITSSSVSSSSLSSSSASSSLWTLVWSDEFTASSIDASKWDFEQNCWGGGNNEQQCYTNRAENSFVENGILKIVARKENFTGPNTPDGSGTTTATLPYTSARLRTKGLEEWTFGRFEIRAKLPFGQGTWPAIWMLPTNSPYGNWASSGEIDIMEAVNLKTVTGNAAPEARVHGTLHYGRAWPQNVSSGADYTLPNSANPADDFHVYALEWEDGEIRWYVDGVHYATQRSSGWYSQYLDGDELKNAPEVAPFDDQSRYHLLLNLAVGGAWAGTVNNTGIDESVFPQTLQIDYVRVYECSVSSQTGKGCATIGENAELVPGNQRPAIGSVELSGPPLLKLYEDSLTEGLVFDSYDPNDFVSHSEVDESNRGKVLNLVKTGATGNFYFKVNGTAVDLRNWSSDSELIFDVKVNSKVDGATLLVKMDSGWPNVSDAVVPLAANGQWSEFRIQLGDLIDNGNSLASGKASLASISNIFVLEPSAAMDVSFDNIRIEGEENQNVEEFAALPLYSIYDDAIPSELQIQSYNPDGAISSSQVDESGRGKIFNVVKTGAAGNVFFNIVDGIQDLNHWAAEGELVFDVKVNSKANNANLLVKMDSGWPNVSDFTVPVAANGEWKEIRIAVADLIDNGNSVTAGSANLNNIANLFVIEPSAAMDVSFDNIRLVVPSSYSIFDDSPNAELQIQSYNPNGLVSTSSVAESNRGNIFRVVKTATGEGNAFFNITSGVRDISDWANAKLKFDYKVSSCDNAAFLLIKMDSGWPNVSDVQISSVDNSWHSYSIGVADLINDGNHYTSQADKANILQISNLFVIEPQGGAMDVAFDNVRIVIE
jgi:beta-glucanase (GH16 family)